MPEPACSGCGEIATLRCSGCLGVFYCGKPCQKGQWKAHKQPCLTATRVRTSHFNFSDSAQLDAKLADNLRKAARGNAEAMFQTGLTLEFGVGVEKSKKEAQAWFRKAGAAGHPQAKAAGCMSAMSDEMLGSSPSS